MVGDDYLLLNVAGVSDVNALKGLVVSGDKDKSNWDKAIAGLSTTMQLFVESNAVPGTYVVDPAQSVTKGPFLSVFTYSKLRRSFIEVK